MSNTRCVEMDQPLSLAQTGHEGFGRQILRVMTRSIDLLLEWQERAGERAHLASLDDRLLRDVGLSRADVENELSLPFWRSR
jgi:uncharacterized protein YjiS (DUF1127 family)